MNSSNIVIWYESGCVEEVHLPDPGYYDVSGDEGCFFGREYIDVSNPDEGIFVERYYVPVSEASDDTAEGTPWRYLSDRERTMVISPAELQAAVLVTCHGVELLRREPWSRFRCRLSQVAPGELGFAPYALDKRNEWLAEGIQTIVSRFLEDGDAGKAAAEDALRFYLQRLIEDDCGAAGEAESGEVTEA